MAFVIAEPCIDELDESCVAVCPVDCIHFERNVDRKAYIDPDECIDCGACEPECPVTAIFPGEALPPTSLIHVELNRRWFQDAATVRVEVEALLSRSA